MMVFPFNLPPNSPFFSISRRKPGPIPEAFPRKAVALFFPSPEWVPAQGGEWGMGRR